MHTEAELRQMVIALADLHARIAEVYAAMRAGEQGLMDRWLDLIQQSVELTNVYLQALRSNRLPNRNDL